MPFIPSELADWLDGSTALLLARGLANRLTSQPATQAAAQLGDSVHCG